MLLFDRAFIWLFTTRAVLHSAVVSARERTSRVFNINGLSHSLSLFCIDGKFDVPFRRLKLMHAVMDN